MPGSIGCAANPWICRLWGRCVPRLLLSWVWAPECWCHLAVAIMPCQHWVQASHS